MTIEAARAVVENTSLPPGAEAELRHRARVRSAHYSTRIEGNRLTLAQAGEVVASSKVEFHGRERDVREVRNYWNALLRTEEWAAAKAPVSEEMIRRLHALVDRGARARPTSYRDGQNVIRDAAFNAIVYLPPEATDVPALMTALVGWCKSAEKERLPVPLIAGLMHYQFVTIHPYYDGNGRTARLLATFVLSRSGYGLNGLLSLEEYHAREGIPAEPELLRKLDRRARQVFALFSKQDRITTPQVAAVLGLSDRMARNLVQGWVAAGWLVIAQDSRRSRAYTLAESYRQYIGTLSATRAHAP